MHTPGRPDPSSAVPGWVWLVAPLPALVATGACQLLDAHMSVAGLAMVYLVAVVAGALLLPRAPSAWASVLCVLALNFFFVPPRGSLAVDGVEYWWTLAVLLGLSLALGSLLAGLRRRRQEAELGRVRAAQLHALSETLAAQQAPDAMAQQAADWLHATLDLSAAVFLRADEGGALQRSGAPHDAAFHERSVAWALEHGRPLGRGCDDWPDLALWCAPFARHGATGAVQLLLPPSLRPAADTLQHWADLARQIGLSIERQRATEEARDAGDAARAEQARNTLLASLAHDLRTPLAGILGSASALRSQSDAMPATQRMLLLANLEDEAQDMTLMADNILQMARLSQTRWEPRTQWEAVDDILGAAVARMRRRWNSASIQLRVAEALPPIQAEASLLAQAITNLVDNAVRHGGGDPRIVVQAGKSREGIFIAVRDHGAGLPPGDTEALFARWQQGASDRPARGTGLGLAICRLVVQAHGGRIGARRCEPGTEFRIDLPVAAAPREAA